MCGNDLQTTAVEGVFGKLLFQKRAVARHDDMHVRIHIDGVRRSLYEVFGIIAAENVYYDLYHSSLSVLSSVSIFSAVVAAASGSALGITPSGSLFFFFQRLFAT